MENKRTEEPRPATLDQIIIKALKELYDSVRISAMKAKQIFDKTTAYCERKDTEK